MYVMNKKLVLINKNTLESLEEKDVVKIVEKFTQTGIGVLSADFGFMFWKREKQEAYHLVYTSPETPYTPKLPRKRGYNYKASVSRIPYFITNPKRDLLPYMKSLAIIPIFYKNHQYGNIVLCFKEKRVFTPEEKPLIMTLANSTAQVLTIHTSNKKTERESLKLLKQKDEFFNIVSHELKTPVTTIKGFSQLLGNKIQKADAQTKFFLDKIDTQTDKLIRLINSLLEVSRLENGKLEFKKCDFELNTLMTRVVEDLKIAIPSHVISCSGVGRFWISGDDDRIEDVFINLITNAAKYSPPGSKIKISLKKKGDFAYVEIEDFGFGILEKDHQKVFSRFFRSKSSNKENLPGLGLGLYISHAIIKNHNGLLDFRSKKIGTGSIFYFSLPYDTRKK